MSSASAVKTYLNKPAGNITRAAGTFGAFSTAWQITGVVVSAGQNVRLIASGTANSTTLNDILIGILRGATQLSASVSSGFSAAHLVPFTHMWVDENPGAGTYTYEVQGALFQAGTLTVYQTVITTDTQGGTSVFTAEVYTP